MLRRPFLASPRPLRAGLVVDLAAADLLEPRDHAQQRRLAAPRGADQHRELAVGDVDVDAVSDGGSVGTAEAYAKDS